MTTILGIDVGGTGIKAAPVAVERGELAASRLVELTPRPATPAAVAATLASIVASLAWDGPIGVAVPGQIRRGSVRFAVNLHPAWSGLDVRALLVETLGDRVAVSNDADAAGLAELRFGAGRGVSGTVVFVALGTGIGTALFRDGTLVPNTELGQIEIDGEAAERQCCARADEPRPLADRVAAIGRYLRLLETLVLPDLVILGGGASEQAQVLIPLLRTDAPVVPATLRNDAGIVGAALATAGLMMLPR